MDCCNSYLLWFDLPLPTYMCKSREANFDQHRVGFLGMFASLVCMHWNWKKMPSSMNSKTRMPTAA